MGFIIYERVRHINAGIKITKFEIKSVKIFLNVLIFFNYYGQKRIKPRIMILTHYKELMLRIKYFGVIM